MLVSRQISSLLLLLLTSQVAAFVPQKNGWIGPKIDSKYAAVQVKLPWGTLALASQATDTSKNTSRNNSNNNNRNRRRNTNTNNNSNYNRQNRDNNGGGGGAGAPTLTLANPMKLHRIVDQVPRDSEGVNGKSNVASKSDDGNRRSKNSEFDAPYSDGDSTTAVGDASPGNKDGNRKRAPGKPEFRRRKEEEDRPNRKRTADKVIDKKDMRSERTSLRVTTSKKGRGAELSQRRGSLKRRDRTAEKEARAEAALERRTVSLPEGPLSVNQLAEIIEEKPVSVIKFLMSDLGIMASMTQNLDPATCVAVVEGFGKFVDDDDDEWMEDIESSALSSGVVVDDDDPDTLKHRAPVVTIMGHVDHGKTSLLDTIRKTQVTAGEAGGITQHIAAYQVEHNGRPITFIDTPGHSAFTDMRERGANITDIVILVVAADDGVKQQTVDSIACARQAGVPLIVAINKCDLETADPVKTMTELTQYDVLTEDFGGEVLSAQISAKTGTGIDDLLDKIMLQAEIQDLKANPKRDAEGIIIEAYVEKGLGTVATTLVKKGTLRVGDIFVAGETYGRIRALISTADDKSRLVEAGPSTPVRVVGFEGIPSAGDILVCAKDDQTARELAESRQRLARERDSLSYQSGLFESVASQFGSKKERRELCVVVKADVQGSAEALSRALREIKMENEEVVVSVKILVSEAGEVSKSDIAIASVTPGTVVIAFNVPASFAAMEDARAAGISIDYYNIVYDAIESVETRMQKILSPTPDGEYSGAAIVQEVFNIGGTGNIAGSRCTDGVLKKGGNVRIMRGDKILKETRIKSLRSFKSEVDSIEEGNDCGIGLIDFEEYEAGDVIECYLE